MMSRAALSLVVALTAVAPALAVSPRVFVKTSGTDSGACPITAPCRTFAYAISQVSAGGEIIALDTGGYGPVTITQSVTIAAAPGVSALIAATGDGVTINAGATDVITLRGLMITGQGGNYGVNFEGGFTLTVENCVLSGFPGAALRFGRLFDTTRPRMNVIGTVLHNNVFGLISYNLGTGTPSAPSPYISYLTIANCQVLANQYGAHISSNSRATVTDTVFMANSAFGVLVSASDPYARPEAMLDRCTLSSNDAAVHVGDFGFEAIVRLANCTITGNRVGVATVADGVLLSRLSNGVTTNTIEGNGTDGAPTGTYAAR